MPRLLILFLRQERRQLVLFEGVFTSLKYIGHDNEIYRRYIKVEGAADVLWIKKY